MKRRGLLLKIATILSSVTLVTGFIAYRAGAFDWLVGKKTDSPAIMSGSKYKVLVQPGQTDGSTPKNYDPAFMSSSKSIIFVEPKASENPK